MNEQLVTVTLDRMISGGQAIGTLDSGKKALLWNALPGETVRFRVTKKKSSFVEGIAEHIDTPSRERIAPRDPASFLSTSPWQIMTFEAEQHYKAALIEEAFELHNIVLPDRIEVWSDERLFHYRNKVEFSFYGTTVEPSGKETLELAFYRRGSKGKIVIEECSLLTDSMMRLARDICRYLEDRGATARQVKSLMIRRNQRDECTWQLYVKDPTPTFITERDMAAFDTLGGEVIYSDPKSPASKITKRLLKTGTTALIDTLLGTPFQYATEGFFQVNLPVYEQALRDMHPWLTPKDPAATPHRVLDLYSGVGTIGLTIGGDTCTLVEIDEHAVREMKRNILALGSSATPVLAASEQALDYIRHDMTVIVDPPRAGLHRAVIDRLLEERPPRIIYLSCNPVTQARDVALLASHYGIRHHKGYNFFPRTPHIEHFVVLDVL